MKFSIITCTWNSMPLLDETIASIDAQDYRDFEHIFVDGGSKDGTLERIARVKGDVKVLRDVGGGITRAMNEGARVATGDVIAHLHSDDLYCAPDVLSRVAAKLTSSNALWLYGRCKSLIDGQARENDYPMVPYSYAALLKRNLVPHPSTFVRRAAFEQAGGFDAKWKHSMDYDLWLKLGRLGAPIQLPDYLASFRFHAGSSSTRNVWPVHIEDFQIRMHHAGRNPLNVAEHLARFGVRSLRLLRQPTPYSGTTAGA